MSIGKGDMVMVVRGMPCCGHMGTAKYGFSFIVVATRIAHNRFCLNCGTDHLIVHYVNFSQDKTDGLPVEMLLKIDPPSEGDSLPTRADLEITA
jgi:hypothetical protein